MENMTIWQTQTKTFWKIETANAIFWMYLGNTAKKCFFRNKTFLFFKIERWNFQNLSEIEFRETSKNCNSFSLFRQLLIFIFSSDCLLELKFCEFYKLNIKQMLKVSAFYLEKQNSFIPKKIFFGSCKYQNKKALFTNSIFRAGFDLCSRGSTIYFP